MVNVAELLVCPCVAKIKAEVSVCTIAVFIVKEADVAPAPIFTDTGKVAAPL